MYCPLDRSSSLIPEGLTTDRVMRRMMGLTYILQSQGCKDGFGVLEYGRNGNDLRALGRHAGDYVGRGF